MDEHQFAGVLLKYIPNFVSHLHFTFDGDETRLLDFVIEVLGRLSFLRDIMFVEHYDVSQQLYALSLGIKAYHKRINAIYELVV